MSYVARTKRAKHRLSKCRGHASHAFVLTHDRQMAVDTHSAISPMEDGVNGDMDVDPPLKESVSIFAAGGLILPPPDIKCTSHHPFLHPNHLSDACTQPSSIGLPPSS